jgi:hypothetical protein
VRSRDRVVVRGGGGGMKAGQACKGTTKVPTFEVRSSPAGLTPVVREVPAGIGAGRAGVGRSRGVGELPRTGGGGAWLSDRGHAAYTAVAR